MIDYNDMLSRQQTGLTLVDGLEGDEKAILQHYCSLMAEGILKAGSQQHAPVDEVVINGIKAGIALGTQLSIANGEVQGRD